MIELLVYLISISSFNLWSCEKNLNWYVEFYTDWKNNITICKNIKRPREEVILHELGHVYYHRILSEKNKIKWHNIYEFSKAFDLFTSEYWRNDEIEDFAESFEYLYLNQKTDEIKPLFIKKIIWLYKVQLK